MNTLSIKDCLRYGWRTFKSRPWIFIAAGATVFLINILFGLPENALDNAARNASGSAATALAVYSVIFGLISFIASLFVKMGTVNFLLKAHDSVEEARVKDLWHPKPFWHFLVASLLTGLAVLLGLILLIVPGIIVGIALSLTLYLVIDKGTGPIEAMKESWKLTKGSRTKLFLLSLAILGINILGLLALVVGLAVTIPVTMLAYAHAYRVLTQEPLPLPEPEPAQQ